MEKNTCILTPNKIIATEGMLSSDLAFSLVQLIFTKHISVSIVTDGYYQRALRLFAEVFNKLSCPSMAGTKKRMAHISHCAGDFLVCFVCDRKICFLKSLILRVATNNCLNHK
jgi:hypothetical protein